METNEIWIQGFSNSIEDVAREVFMAGYVAGQDNSNAEFEFREWLKRERE